MLVVSNVSCVDRKASNAKELVSGLVMVNNKQTEAPNRGASVR
jgi:hypothetical protein